MCADSPGSGMAHAQPTPKAQSDVSSYHNQHPVNVRALRAFKAIVKSCYGPHSRTKLIQNNCGGHVTVTSSSQRLLSTLSLSKPALKLISAAVEGHLSVYSDGGLCAALFACTLVEECWDVGLHPMMCVAINELLGDICKDVMMSEMMPIDVSSMDSLLSVVQSVIGSKPGCGLVDHQRSFISSLVVRAFISSIPNPESTSTITIPQIPILGVELFGVDESYLVEGVLVEAPEIPVFDTRDVRAPRVQSGSHSGSIRVALFNISLAGDSEEFADASYELASGLKAEDATILTMLNLADHLVDMEVGLVACQKVVHPSIKRRLREKGILTVDRLSLLHVGTVQQLSGAQPLSSISGPIPSDCFGYLTDIKHRPMFGKSFLHLSHTSSPLTTLVLCHYTEQALEELKHVCQVAFHTLALLLRDPTVLPGAGCLELVLSHRVKDKMKASTWQDIGCTRHQFLQVAEKFASSLAEVAMATAPESSHMVTDSTSRHSWHLPHGAMDNPDWLRTLGSCACGMRNAVELQDSHWWIVGNLRCGVHFQNERTGEGSVNDICGATGEGSIQTNTTANGKAGFGHKYSSIHTQEVLDLGKTSVAPCKKVEKKRSREKTRGVIMDAYAVKYNAVCLAVDVANMVLRIGHTVEDVN